LRQAYDYWQDQPDYYLQAMLPSGAPEEAAKRAAEPGSVRFGKMNCMVLAAATGSDAPGPLKDLCFRDLQPTRVRHVKRRWENPSAVYAPHSSEQAYSLLGFRPG
jgi:hypothetical protein